MSERLADLPPEEQVERVTKFVEAFVMPHKLADWQREWIRKWWLRGCPNPLRSA
ncbi:hypothetical protein [Microbispora sp. NPDC049633]|uniref:hypothetical protein n=1 Tax=Microbispora sp. NPDC049633 TaxID=3154355 RepID=UPI0034418865